MLSEITSHLCAYWKAWTDRTPEGFRIDGFHETKVRLLCPKGMSYHDTAEEAHKAAWAIFMEDY